MFYVTV